MMPSTLITGASGFLGRHLLNRLAAILPTENEIISVGRRHPGNLPSCSFWEVDLLDSCALANLVRKTKPDVVYHLAGRTPPGTSDDFYRQNTLATLYLLDHLRAAGRRCRLVIVGSAAELGPVPEVDLPVAEDHPARPADSYGLSKWLASCAGSLAGPPIEAILARVFNPIGPGLPASQAFGRFANLLADGTGPTRLLVGDLGARRDFVDVRDVARALIALADQGQAGRVYHVGTGVSHRLGDGLDRLISWSGREVTVEVDPTRTRSHGPRDSRADVGRIAREVGWSAEIPFEESLRDLWDDAVSRARAGLTDRPPPV